MKLVGCVSSYREGDLLRAAIGSLLVPGIDYIVVFEGPAGEVVSAEAPESWTPDREGVIAFEQGAWQTDAAKRTAIVKHVQKRFPKEQVWGVWVDGDEVLLNGAFLRDLLQAVSWRDEADGGQPTAGFPIRLFELDGTVATCRAKVLRLDLVANYVVSSSGIRFKNGVVQAEGNLPFRLSEWWIPERMEMLERGEFVAAPPLPGEPHLLHRSALRHPVRLGVRMHEQEARELKRLGIEIPT